jgi:hypothetical protein
MKTPQLMRRFLILRDIPSVQRRFPAPAPLHQLCQHLLRMVMRLTKERRVGNLLLQILQLGFQFFQFCGSCSSSRCRL